MSLSKAERRDAARIQKDYYDALAAIDAEWDEAYNEGFRDGYESRREEEREESTE
jgi:hypothetical protein